MRFPVLTVVATGVLAPTARLTFCGPGARVAPVMPSAGIFSVRPEARHHCRTSRSHLVPSFAFMSKSYQTAIVRGVTPSFSSQIAT